MKNRNADSLVHTSINQVSDFQHPSQSETYPRTSDLNPRSSDLTQPPGQISNPKRIFQDINGEGDELE